MFQDLLLACCITLLGPDVSHETKVNMIASTVGVDFPSEKLLSVPVLDGVYSLLAFIGTLVPCKSLLKDFSDGVQQAGVQSTCLLT